MRMVLAALGAVLASHVAAAAEAAPAAWDQRQSAQCAEAIGAAERKHGTAPGLVGAIAKTESGRPVAGMAGLQPWPWAVNADGAAMYFDGKAAAVAWTRQALARGTRQIDVGCMQVNLQAHPDAFGSLEDAFDPAANADYAARFLTRLQQEAGGNWHVATGRYHSRTPARADNYRERVAAIAAGRPPPPGIDAPLYLRALRQGTLRIKLANGRALRLNVGRQPSARARKRLTPCEAAAVLGDYMAQPARTGCATFRNANPARKAGVKG